MLKKTTLFKVLWRNGQESVLEGSDIKEALKNHYYPYHHIYEDKILDFNELIYNKPIIINNSIDFISDCS